MKLFFHLLLAFIITFVSVQPAYAQEFIPLSPTTTPTVFPTVTPFEYQLPYPGLLPDNPLYNLKIVRDRVVEFLISDSLKKTEFYLLQADKRLNMGVFVAKKGKYDLAQSTISKGENYFEQALSSAQEAKKQGMDITPIAQRFPLAAKKHTLVLKDLEKSAPKDFKDDFIHLQKRVAEIEKKITVLHKKK